MKDYLKILGQITALYIITTLLLLTAIGIVFTTPSIFQDDYSEPGYTYIAPVAGDNLSDKFLSTKDAIKVNWTTTDPYEYGGKEQ